MFHRVTPESGTGCREATRVDRAVVAEAVGPACIRSQVTPAVPTTWLNWCPASRYDQLYHTTHRCHYYKDARTRPHAHEHPS